MNFSDCISVLLLLMSLGTVRVKLYKGNVSITGRKSPYSLYDKMIASFEDDGGLYNQADAGEMMVACITKQMQVR
jgi:argininosuccinate synthase